MYVVDLDWSPIIRAALIFPGAKAYKWARY